MIGIKAALVLSAPIAMSCCLSLAQPDEDKTSANKESFHYRLQIMIGY
jgi:hypothetical protein